MSRKDYKLIARALADTYPQSGRQEGSAQALWEWIRSTFAQSLQNDNACFDLERFNKETEKYKL